MRTINVCPGIGDNIWLFQKLINSGERFSFRMSNQRPQRGKQVFDLLPQISAACEYVPGLKYKSILQKSERGLWQSFKHKQDFYLCANAHLEAGRHISSFLPDLKTSYTLDYKTSRNDVMRASSLLPIPNAVKYVGLYGSAYSTQRAWGFWDEHGWCELAERISAKDENIVFVIIGATFDNDLGSALAGRLRARNIAFINTIGEPLSVVVEILKKLRYFFGFPSGLSVLNQTLGKAGTMFYPPHLRRMMGTWRDPEHDGEFKECEFCPPAKIFEWWDENIQL